jgi:hypothetical protein
MTAPLARPSSSPFASWRRGVLIRRDRQAVIFLGICEICLMAGPSCQICDAARPRPLTPMGGPICEQCLEQLQ